MPDNTVNTIRVRLARDSDTEAMLEIYLPLVKNAYCTLEFTPPSVSDFYNRIATGIETAPWLVCEIGGKIAGYAYAQRFRPRAGYQWATEVSVYVHPDFRRRNVAMGLYTALFDCLRAQGFFTALAVIVLPNPPSVALHEKLGFTAIGVQHDIGYKNSHWRDVGWWELSLRRRMESPAPPRSLAAVTITSAWQEAMHKGEALIKG
ncbi:N-acetyltransferase family protein [candidate division KSB1 bacterium]|nr:MAG: N-acetyltransferase family protein [candidate division KSB1 bacterium]